MAPDQQTNTCTPPDDINSPNHPLYLHPNDHPGIILISKKLSGSDNYNTWKRSIMIALNAENKLKLVNGEFEEPNLNSPIRALWERTNDMVISWILNTISDQISNSLNFINFASDLWSELCEHYSQLDGHRIYQLVNDIVQLKQQNCNIEVYYHKLKGLWDEHDALEAPYMCICACNCENGRVNSDRDQRKRLIQFLMGLDESYSNIRGQILLMQPLPTVAKAYGMIRQEEKQREGILPKPTTSAVFSTYSNGSTSRNYNNTQRNNQRSQTERRSTFRAGIYCTNCGKEGHYREECYKLKGYPIRHPLHGIYKPPVVKNVTDSKGKAVNSIVGQDSNSSSSSTAANDVNDAVFVKIDQLQNQLNQVMLMMQRVQKDPPTGIINSITIRRHKFIASIMIRFKTAWVVDSGATDHICITLTIMHNIQTCNPPILITLPNG
ncbi:cysteine-rich receptor-like protein kinase 8 [Tanacetum coccineum]